MKRDPHPRMRVRPRRWQPLQKAIRLPKTAEQLARSFDEIRAVAPAHITDEAIRQSLTAAEAELGDLWKNDVYQVHRIVHENGPGGRTIVQLSIKRIDRLPLRDWRHFQRIKNELVGPNCEGVELYPAEDRLVDTANQYHLWCVPDPTFRFPIGYQTERTVINEGVAGAMQRPLEDDADDDAPTPSA